MTRSSTKRTSISGDAALIGSVLDDNDLGANAGSAYIYRFDGATWNEEAKLTASDGLAGDQLGQSVSIDGDVVAIGAAADDNDGTSSGSAYIFRFDGTAWHEEALLTAPDALPGDLFGFSISIRDNVAVIGARFGDPLNAGSVYVFQFDGTSWDLDAKLVASDGASEDEFGFSVAADVSAVVGAWRDDAPGSNSGSAYVFSLVSDSDADGLPDDGDNCPSTANPAQADFDGDGLGDACDDDDDDDELSDADETSAGSNPFDADTDDDTLSDGDEVNVHGTDPTSLDTDQDLLSDGDEVALAAFGGCPDPTVADSDGDGLHDGIEVTLTLDPCDADTDADGLADGLEEAFGTSGTDPDSDDDGFLDGTEVDIAQGTGCPSPTNADSDGDGILDGAEADLATSPCSADTDGDGVADNEDDQPTEPGVTTGYIEDALRDLAGALAAMELDVFDAPNPNARKGRRNALSSKVQATAKKIAQGKLQEALDKIEDDLLPKLDGQPSPGDWMVAGDAQLAVYDELWLLATLIAIELE